MDAASGSKILTVPRLFFNDYLRDSLYFFGFIRIWVNPSCSSRFLRHISTLKKPTTAVQRLDLGPFAIDILTMSEIDSPPTAPQW
jgi:hypothetical protein